MMGTVVFTVFLSLQVFRLNGLSAISKWTDINGHPQWLWLLVGFMLLDL